MMAGGLLVFPEEDSIIPDVSRLTGVPWFYARIHQRGPLHPVIDTGVLPWSVRLGIAFALAGGHSFVDNREGITRGTGDSDHVTDRVVGGGAD